MGSIPSAAIHKEISLELEKPLNCEDVTSLDDAKKEIARLRLKIVENIPLQFPYHVVFALYAPPQFPIHSHGEYLAKRVCLPLIDVNALLETEFRAITLVHMVESDQHKREESRRKEEAMMKAFEDRITESDCSRGYVLVQYPDTVQQLIHMKSLLNGKELLSIFYELDNETMRQLQYKWDRWVHPASGRSYHLLTSPPKRMVETGNDKSAPKPEFMVDDETNEPLIQLEEDSLAHYKKLLDDHRAKELPLCTHFDNMAIHIPGCTSRKDTNREVTKVITRILSQTPLTGDRPDFRSSRRYLPKSSSQIVLGALSRMGSAKQISSMIPEDLVNIFGGLGSKEKNEAILAEEQDVAIRR